MSNIKRNYTVIEFIKVLSTIGTSESFDYDDSIQTGLLEFFSSLFTNEPNSQNIISSNVIHFPDVKQFIVEIIGSLDPSLEFKARKVFLQGKLYVADSIGCSSDDLSIINIYLEKLGERFPELPKELERKLVYFIIEFFRPTIGEFFVAQSRNMIGFHEEFPLIYELFVRSLEAEEKYKNSKLFNFYCNPWIYNSIMNFLSGKEVSKNTLKSLEEKLQLIRSCSSKESWEELAAKSCKLLNESSKLESFADASMGLFGEIEAAYYFAKKECKPSEFLILRKDEDKDRNKNCDGEILRKDGSVMVLYEVKTKGPRHGVKGNIGVCDDFLSNFLTPISSYLTYLDCNIDTKFDFNLNRCFPLFFGYEGSEYRRCLFMINNLLNKLPSDENSIDKWNSEEKIKICLRALFFKPIFFSSSCVQRNAEDFCCSKRHQEIQTVLQNDWLKNNIKKAIDQLRQSCDRLTEKGSLAPKLYVVLNLFLSDRLLQDPYSNNDENMKSLVIEKVSEIFQPFKDELSIDVYDLYLKIL